MVVSDIRGSELQVLEGCWSVNCWLMSDCLPVCLTDFEWLSVSLSSALGASNNNSVATSGGDVTGRGRLADSIEWRTQAIGLAQLLVLYCKAASGY